MNLVLFAHPAFVPSQSMHRFTRMLERAYRASGHRVEVWRPEPWLRRWVSEGPLSKWAGYVDQYVLFPLRVVRQVRRSPRDALFVFCDQALGPWVPLIGRRPSVVHVNDLLALRSALGHFPENPTRLSGRAYQHLIRAGFRRARHFISISEKTRSDLHTFGKVEPLTSEVVYLGLNDAFVPVSASSALDTLRRAGLNPDGRGMLLCVGANVWYKNRVGVLRIYEHYAKRFSDPLPLWVVGPPPAALDADKLARSVLPGCVQFVQGIDHQCLQAAYSLARASLFPSLAEGFGWPIVEAMACGCPVLTTDEAPMTEVGGSAARYLPRLVYGEDIDDWASRCASKLCDLLSLGETERAELVQAGFTQAGRFSVDHAIGAYLDIYQRVWELERGSLCVTTETTAQRAGAPIEGG